MVVIAMRSAQLGFARLVGFDGEKLVGEAGKLEYGFRCLFPVHPAVEQKVGHEREPLDLHAVLRLEPDIDIIAPACSDELPLSGR